MAFAILTDIYPLPFEIFSPGDDSNLDNPYRSYTRPESCLTVYIHMYMYMYMFVHTRTCTCTSWLLIDALVADCCLVVINYAAHLMVCYMYMYKCTCSCGRSHTGY